MNGRIAALLGIFAPLSLLTIGGGQTIIAGIQRQVVDVHGWMSAGEFVTLFAIARMAPGPGSLLATLIGWNVAGFWGAVAATIGIFTPTCVLIYGVARVWARYRGARWQKALEGGLRPLAAGMILATVWVLMSSLEGGWLARCIAIASTAILLLTEITPLLLLALGAAAFVLLRAL
jgi:chromate transporter